MSQYNPDFWEVPTDIADLDRVPAAAALYYETEEDRDRRYAMSDFYQEVAPAVASLIEECLTRRQREIIQLYYLHNKTQEDIAAILQVAQSTVSRHLNGTVRGGRKVGGAIHKLRKVMDRVNDPVIARALGVLQRRLGVAA